MWVKFRIKRINSRSTASYDKNKDSAPEFGVKYREKGVWGNEWMEM